MTAVTTDGSMVAALHQAVAGDETAFARIVATYYADMVRVAYGICADSEMALDAVQSAWAIAWRKLRAIREPEHLRSWLVAVAANEARHLARRDGKVRVVEITVDPPGAESADPAHQISRLDLVNALRRLTPDDRRLIALRYGADLDSTEIAPLLRISPSGVRVRLMRIMRRLREELEDG